MFDAVLDRYCSGDNPARICGRPRRLADILALRLSQLEASRKSRDVADRLGVSWGTCFALCRAQRNPTCATMEKIAATSNTSLPGLLGFTDDDTRQAVARVAIDYDRLTEAISDKSVAEEKIDSSASIHK
ncbi:MAG: XRE family transcriptional regulator [Bradyrhizobium sp.]